MPDPLYYLICSQDPIPLLTDKHMFFGRAEGNNIVVDDVRASRRHAELYWDGANFVLIDLNSSNGTRVNDENITTHVLKDCDEIQIGLETFRYRVVEDPAELDTWFETMEKNTRCMVTAEMPSLKDSIPDTDFNGTLATMSVVEICQTLQLGQRSGLLLVVDEHKEKGLLYFREGAITGAECGLVKGDDAAFKVLRFKRGSFSFRSQAPALDKNVTQSTPHLLLESARRGDEDTRT